MPDALGLLAAALAGRYPIDHEICEDVMDTVLVSYDLKHHRKAAIVVLKPEPGARAVSESLKADWLAICLPSRSAAWTRPWTTR